MNATRVGDQEMSESVANGRAESNWPEILAAVSNRSFERAEFVRLILMEMSLVCQELQVTSAHSSLVFKLKPLLAEMHALRTLAETARYATELATEDDVVNLDGPKFMYVIGQLCDLVKESAQKAGCGPLVVDTVARGFRYGLAEREDEIRRNIDKVGAVLNPADDSVWLRGSSKSVTSRNANIASLSESEGRKPSE
jgi:hypothetical protein